MLNSFIGVFQVRFFIRLTNIRCFKAHAKHGMHQVKACFKVRFGKSICNCRRANEQCHQCTGTQASQRQYVVWNQWLVAMKNRFSELIQQATMSENSAVHAGIKVAFWSGYYVDVARPFAFWMSQGLSVDDAKILGTGSCVEPVFCNLGSQMRTTHSGGGSCTNSTLFR